jgi:hypothetical protein
MSRDELSGPDLEGVVADANAVGLSYVVIGGFSVIANGFLRATDDSDLLVPDGPETDQAILRFLERSGAGSRRRPAQHRRVQAPGRVARGIVGISKSSKRFTANCRPSRSPGSTPSRRRRISGAPPQRLDIRALFGAGRLCSIGLKRRRRLSMLLYKLMGYLHAAIEGRARAIRTLVGERGQGTVEYVGLILLVSLLMVGMVAAMKGFNGKQGTELADVIVNKIKEAVDKVAFK